MVDKYFEKPRFGTCACLKSLVPWLIEAEICCTVWEEHFRVFSAFLEAISPPFSTQIWTKLVWQGIFQNSDRPTFLFYLMLKNCVGDYVTNGGSKTFHVGVSCQVSAKLTKNFDFYNKFTTKYCRILIFGKKHFFDLNL